MSSVARRPLLCLAVRQRRQLRLLPELWPLLWGSARGRPARAELSPAEPRHRPAGLGRRYLLSAGRPLGQRCRERMRPAPRSPARPGAGPASDSVTPRRARALAICCFASSAPRRLQDEMPALLTTGDAAGTAMPADAKSEAGEIANGGCAVTSAPWPTRQRPSSERALRECRDRRAGVAGVGIFWSLVATAMPALAWPGCASFYCSSGVGEATLSRARRRCTSRRRRRAATPGPPPAPRRPPSPPLRSGSAARPSPVPSPASATFCATSAEPCRRPARSRKSSTRAWRASAVARSEFAGRAESARRRAMRTHRLRGVRRLWARSAETVGRNLAWGVAAPTQYRPPGGLYCVGGRPQARGRRVRCERGWPALRADCDCD